MRKSLVKSLQFIFSDNWNDRCTLFISRQAPHMYQSIHAFACFVIQKLKQSCVHFRPFKFLTIPAKYLTKILPFKFRMVQCLNFYVIRVVPCEHLPHQVLELKEAFNRLSGFYENLLGVQHSECFSCFFLINLLWHRWKF